MSDAINTLMSEIETALRAGMAAGSIKDGNIPVRNVWRGLKSDFTRNQIPIIQFEESPGGPGGGGYRGDSMVQIPFSVIMICWVTKGVNERDTLTRARAMRQSALDYLHTQRPFSRAGGARQGLIIRRDVDAYRLPYAIGAGAIISGDLMQVA